MFEKLKKLQRDIAGVQALEFALIAPLLIAMVLGTIEVGRYVLLNQKISKTIFALGDLVTRKNTLTAFDVAQSFPLASKTLAPFDTTVNQLSSRTSMRVSAFNRPVGSAKAQRVWNCAVGTSITAPTPALNIQENEGIFLVEIAYNYKTIFVPTALNNFFNSQDVIIYRQQVVRPRTASIVPSWATLQTRSDAACSQF